MDEPKSLLDEAKENAIYWKKQADGFSDLLIAAEFKLHSAEAEATRWHEIAGANAERFVQSESKLGDSETIRKSLMQDMHTQTELINSLESRLHKAEVALSDCTAAVKMWKGQYEDLFGARNARAITAECRLAECQKSNLEGLTMMGRQDAVLVELRHRLRDCTDACDVWRRENADLKKAAVALIRQVSDESQPFFVAAVITEHPELRNTLETLWPSAVERQTPK